jgi:hypothetical protein
VRAEKRSLVYTNWKGLARNRSILLRCTVPACLEGLWKTMPAVRMVSLAAGIRTGDLGMQVESVSVCVKLLSEVRNSFGTVKCDGTGTPTVQIQSAK